MRRFVRWLLNALTVLSLLLCVATAALWVRSYWRLDDFGWESYRLDTSGPPAGGDELEWRRLQAESRDGQLSLLWDHASVPVVELFGSVEQFHASHLPPSGPFWLVVREPQNASPLGETVWGRLGFGYDTIRSTGGRSHGVYAPHWATVLALLSLPLARGAAAWRRRRMRPCTCAACSYDLTGNVSGVCPECGTKVVREAA